jgi:hypothetical protein
MTYVQPQTADITAIRLYPNPTKGMLVVETPSGGTMVVYTIDGKEVSTYIIKESNSTIMLPKGIAGGIYMCRFTASDGATAIVRLVYEP